MNILFLAGSLGLGGAEKQLLAWARILQEDFDARVAVVSFDETRQERLPALDQMGISLMIAGRDQSPLRRLGGLVAFARRNKVDVVHAFTYYLSTPAILAAAAARAIPASSFQGDGLTDVERLNALRRLPAEKIVRYFTCNSHETIARVRPRLRADVLLQYVPNLVSPPDSGRIAMGPPEKGRGPVALLVARLDANKRVPVFLQALAAAREFEPQLKGVVVGDGPDRTMLAGLAAELGLLPDGVSFLGWLRDPWECYATAQMFVHLARSEGTPNVVLEAMAMGLPVVATPAGDVPHIIQQGRNGLLVPFDDVPAVTGRLVDLVRSPALRAQLGQQGRADVLRSYGTEQVRTALRDFYSTLDVGLT
jgi:glycosyltransferase involved in cell wall biosynthesis